MKIALYFVITIICISCTQKPPKLIPVQNLEKLAAFFELVIKDYDFGYTLFGNKPCSIVGYRVDNLYKNSSIEAVILEEGWAQWCRYKHLFPSPNFVLKQIIDTESETVREILIINKSATLNILKAHLSTFHDILNYPYQAEELLSKMIEDENFLKELMNRSEILGILLGYGKINSVNFAKRFELCLYINKLSVPPLDQNWNELNPSSLKLVKGYSHIGHEPNFLNSSLDLAAAVKELNTLTTTLEIFELPGSDFLLEQFQSPIFIANRSEPETQKLYRDYCETRVKIIEAYQGKSILDVTLNQWTRK